MKEFPYHCNICDFLRVLVVRQFLEKLPCVPATGRSREKYAALCWTGEEWTRREGKGKECKVKERNVSEEK